MIQENNSGRHFLLIPILARYVNNQFAQEEDTIEILTDILKTDKKNVALRIQLAELLSRAAHMKNLLMNITMLLNWNLEIVLSGCLWEIPQIQPEIFQWLKKHINS